jgi:hypothetical protein
VLAKAAPKVEGWTRMPPQRFGGACGRREDGCGSRI